jgi:SAM-dependent methyltransferase
MCPEQLRAGKEILKKNGQMALYSEETALSQKSEPVEGGQLMIRNFVRRLQQWYFALGSRVFRPRTLMAIHTDMIRFLLRLRTGFRGNRLPAFPKLNAGCGGRRFPDWVNVDLTCSDVNMDLAAGRLPWREASFTFIVSLHFIEHLDLMEECLPLLQEFRRVLEADGELWLACPDMEKVCRAYLQGELEVLYENRRQRWSDYQVGLPARRTAVRLPVRPLAEHFSRLPLAYMVNDYFHQYGEHCNLYDEEILRWALMEAGFVSIARVSEEDLRTRFPEIPLKNDDIESIYLRAGLQ